MGQLFDRFYRPLIVAGVTILAVPFAAGLIDIRYWSSPFLGAVMAIALWFLAIVVVIRYVRQYPNGGGPMDA